MYIHGSYKLVMSRVRVHDSVLRRFYSLYLLVQSYGTQECGCALDLYGNTIELTSDHLKRYVYMGEVLTWQFWHDEGQSL